VFRLAATAGIAGVVSFSDPVARTTADGALVKPGHVGIIYQAANAAYLGLSTPRTHVLLRDGTVFDDRTDRRLVVVQALNGTPFTQETHRPAKGMVGHVTGAPAEPLPALLEPQ
jgi:hypothetical protein